jgi:hypothetical protein
MVLMGTSHTLSFAASPGARQEAIALAALEKPKKEPAPVKAEAPAPEPVKAQEESAQADNATDGLFGG